MAVIKYETPDGVAEIESNHIKNKKSHWVVNEEDSKTYIPRERVYTVEIGESSEEAKGEKEGSGVELI